MSDDVIFRPGRQLALQMMYSLEHHDYNGAYSCLAIEDQELLPKSDKESQFAQQLIAGFVVERAAVDAAITSKLTNWTLERLAVVDRNVLRLGAYELIYTKQPPRVLLNEYIELTKYFGSEVKTSKLVNAVLDKIAKQFRSQNGALK